MKRKPPPYQMTAPAQARQLVNALAVEAQHGINLARIIELATPETRDVLGAVIRNASTARRAKVEHQEAADRFDVREPMAAGGKVFHG